MTSTFPLTTPRTTRDWLSTATTLYFSLKIVTALGCKTVLRRLTSFMGDLFANVLRALYPTTWPGSLANIRFIRPVNSDSSHLQPIRIT